MNMKKILLCFVLGGVSLLAQAQDAATVKANKQERDSLLKIEQFNALKYMWQPRFHYANDEWTNNGFWDHTYLQVGSGLFNIDGKGATNLKIDQSWNFTIGKDITPYHGVRLGFGSNFAKAGTGSEQTYRSTDLHADWLFNLSNYTAGYKKDRFIDVQTVAGLGVERVHYLQTKRLIDARLGLDVRFRLGNRNYLTLEPMAVVSRNNGVYPLNTQKYVFNYGMNVNWGYYIHEDAVIAHPKTNSELLNPIFFELGVGPIFRSGDDLRTSKTMGPAYNINIGSWMSPVWGVRTGIEWASSTNNYDSRNNTIYAHSANVFDVKGELLFNPFGLKDTYNEDQRFGAHLIGGYVYGVNDPHYGASRYFHGWTAGANLWARVDKNAEVYVEPSVRRLVYANRYATPDQSLYTIMAGVRMKTYQKADRDVRAMEEFNPYWFMQLGYGFGNDIRKEWVNGESEQYWRGNWEMAIGRRFDDLFAVRLALGQNYKWEKDDWRETFLSPQLMLNVNTWINRYSSEDRLNAYLYGGPYMSKVRQSGLKDGRGGLLAGVQFDYAVSPNTSIYFVPEIRNTFISNSSQENDWDVAYKLGVSYRFDNGANYEPFWNGNSFIELGAGINRMVNTDLDFGTGANIQAGFGKWFDRVLGAKLGANYTFNKAGEVNAQLLGMSADVMVDPISWLNSNYDRTTAKAGLSLLFGGNWGVLNHRTDYTGYHSKAYAGFNQGAQLWVRAGQTSRLFVEGRYSQLRNGNVLGHNFLKPLDVTVGVAFDYDELGGSGSKTKIGDGKGQTLEQSVLNYKVKFDNRYWFLENFFGATVNQSKQTEAGSSKENWRKNWGLGLGYRWSNVSAIRAVAQQDVTLGGRDFREASVALEYMFNINGLMNHNDDAERLSLWAFAGPYAQASQNIHTDKFNYGLAGGFQLNYRLNKSTSLFLAPEVRVQGNQSKDYNFLAKAGVSYRFAGSDHYDHFWNEDSYVELGAGIQSVMDNTDDKNIGPRIEMGLGKWYDRVWGTRFGGYYGMNTGNKQNLRNTGATVDLMVDAAGLLSKNYDRNTALAGFNLFLGGDFGILSENRNENWNKSYIHMMSGFREGAQIWFRANETSRIFVQGTYSQLHTGNNVRGTNSWYKPLAITAGVSMNYEPKFMRDNASEPNEQKFYVQAGVGGAWRADGNNHDYQSGLSVSVDAGYQPNVNGIRISGDWNNLEPQSIDVAAQYQMDLQRMFQGANSNSAFGAYLFAGPMVKMTKNVEETENLTAFGARLGAELRVKLGGGAYLHVTPTVDRAKVDGKAQTWFRGTAGVGYSF